MSPRCLGMPLHSTASLRLGRPKKPLQARWFGRTVEVWIPTEETLSLELFQLRLKLPAALCKAMIQTHWAA